MSKATERMARAALCGWNNVPLGFFDSYEWPGGPAGPTRQAWERAITRAILSVSEAELVEARRTADVEFDSSV